MNRWSVVNGVKVTVDGRYEYEGRVSRVDPFGWWAACIGWAKLVLVVAAILGLFYLAAAALTGSW